MTEYFQKNLFKGISIGGYKKLLSCLDGRTKQFKAGEAICGYDEGFHEIGIIGKGITSVAHCEYSGAGTILERLGPQDIFGHLLSYEDGEHAGISVVCDSPYDILFTHHATIGSPCTESYAHHHQLIQNLLDLITGRTLNSSRRMEVLSQRTIREELIRYFMQLAAQARASSFNFPFTMVDLVGYLSIDRSAMTRELKRMKEEELIGMDKRCVRLFL